jgi:hypothetical protein
MTVAVLMCSLACVSAARSLARQALLDAVLPLDRGFRATAADRKRVAGLIRSLAIQAPAASADLEGEWELVYSDAPDIVGSSFGGVAMGVGGLSGLLGTAVRIGQSIDADARTIANVIEYQPPAWLASAVPGLASDRLQQRVLLSYATSGTRCDLTLRGAALAPRTALGISLLALPPLELRGPLSVPFGSFEVLYNDGELRAVRTRQGFFGVNRRLPDGISWGP